MNSPGLYIHIPFCRSKCPYCDFFSIASTTLVPRWLDALKEEVSCYKDQFSYFDSLYLGGGTPTVLTPEVLASVMDVIFTHFTLKADPEITIEANPCDLTQANIKKFIDMGFNRFSIGVQSFDDRVLSFLGRRHSVLQAEQAIEDLRSHGANNISIDLIYGFEGQQVNDWIKTLSRALSFRPEHLSCYQLTIENRTHFGSLRDRGLLRPLNDKEEGDIFLETSRFLEDKGYIHYEISNFAREDIYSSRHNSKYWHHIPYLGLGPSAHSFNGSKRWWNVRSIRKYCKALEKGRLPVKGSEHLSRQQFHFETIILGLRTADGLDQDAVVDNHQSRKLIHRFQEDGFLKIEKGRVFPTRRGFLVADYLASCLGS